MILISLQKALRSLLQGKIFLIVCLPTVVALFFWIYLLFIFWGALVGILQSALLPTFVVSWPTYLINLFLNVESAVVANFIATALMVFMSIPMMYITNLFLVSILLMPLLLTTVVKTDYPHLEKKQGGTLIGSIINNVWASMTFFIGIIVSLPLWLVPGFTMLVPMVLNAYLNQKVFLYDVLQDFASKDERQIIKEKFWDKFSLGLLTAFLNYIPVVNLFSAAITALCFIHFGLSQLQELRTRSKIEGDL